MKAERSDSSGRVQRGCNVNSAFNFTAGGFAIAAALLIGYMTYVYWWR